jgi:hypothetical protein
MIGSGEIIGRALTAISAAEAPTALKVKAAIAMAIFFILVSPINKKLRPIARKSQKEYRDSSPHVVAQTQQALSISLECCST